MSQIQSLCRNFALGALLLGLGACAGSRVENFTDQDIPSSSRFETALAAEYQGLASNYAERESWRNALYITEKGRRALKGRAPTPTKPEERAVLQGDFAELKGARDALVTTLNAHRARRPAPCAEAQRDYDDWLIQASSNRLGVDGSFFGGRGGPPLTAEREDLRNAFQAALDRCAGRRVRIVLAGGGAFQSRAGKALPEIGKRTVYFEFNSSRLDAPGRGAVNAIARMIADLERHRIEVTGHTDRAGPTHYNQILGKDRANTVARALRASGARTIATFSVGETQLAVPTADDVREPLNRRTEILIKGE